MCPPFALVVRVADALHAAIRFSRRYSVLLLTVVAWHSFAVEPGPTVLYDRIKSFDLQTGPVLEVSNFVLHRDRIELTLSGHFYPLQNVGGKVYGGILLGGGKIKVVPTSTFEKDNMKRLLKVDVLETTFSNAVLRFTDDTYEQIAAHANSVAPTSFDGAQRMARESDERVLRQFGLNAAERTLVAVENGDEPGFFFAEFDGGPRGRFAAVVDHQARIGGSIFGVNGGEKGLLFQYLSPERGTDIWTAFYDEQDFRQGKASYSDAFDVVHITDYRMDIGLLEPKQLRLDVEMDLVALRDHLQAVPMDLNDAFDDFRDERLKKALRATHATLADGTPVGVIQDKWQKGLALVLPDPVARGQKVTVKLHLESKEFLDDWQGAFFYPLATTDWFPRHGYLRHSRFDLTFHHKETTLVASVGERVLDTISPDKPGEHVTRWLMNDPIPLTTFAVGPFERHSDVATVGDRKVPIELYSLPRKWAQYGGVKADFMLAELGNGVRYYSALFGDFPFKRLGAVFFPANFGQGFPTLLLLPALGYTREVTFISHECAHEWWGDQITWRSYRDQWLSEGFADYSAMLYTEKRRERYWELEHIRAYRNQLHLPVRGEFTRLGTVKVYEVGPLILGRRLYSRESREAYFLLTYGKGSLVLRMLHFLFTNPADGNDDGFFAMMKDFAQRYRDRPATTENFFQVASEHFARSSIGRQVGAKDLDWFLQQWVYQTGLPSYRLEYGYEPRPGGGVTLSGTLYQEGVEKWFMPLPLVMEFSGGRSARTAVYALGPSTPVKLALPEEPRSVKLDPDLWILTDKVSERRLK